MVDDTFTYDILQYYLPKERFVDALRRVWSALFYDSTPSRESMAVIWSRMALKVVRTGACPYVGEEDLFEPVLDEVFLLTHGEDDTWSAVLAGDPEALLKALDAQDRGKPDWMKQHFISLEADYHKLLDLMTEWLLDTTDVPTIPAPAPIEPATTKPETPHSIRISMRMEDDEESDE